MVGYGSKVITNVEVNTDRTTNLDIELVASSVSIDDIIVVAEKPVIRKT
ncbi:MAG: hypothetical protein U5K00_16145 [Melioribacteraceae bacterium]|nr:hypothetical protein [Melioribacteraceae bacterium]